jgi:hypothetical protein
MRSGPLPCTVQCDTAVPHRDDDSPQSWRAAAAQPGGELPQSPVVTPRAAKTALLHDWLEATFKEESRHDKH